MHPWLVWLRSLAGVQVVALSSDELATVLVLRDVHRRASLAQGHGAALVEADVVQDVIIADHASKPLRKLVSRTDASSEARLHVWSVRSWLQRVEIPGVVSRDGHDFTVRVELPLRLEPHVSRGARAPALPLTRALLEARLHAGTASALSALAADTDGDALFHRWPGDGAISDAVMEAVHTAANGLAAIDGPPRVILRNPFFEARHGRQREAADERDRLAFLEETSRIRGAVRRVALQDLQGEADMAAAALIVRQDDDLKKRALALELERADFEVVSERLALARRGAALVDQLLAEIADRNLAAFDSGSELAVCLQPSLPRFMQAGFSAHEVQIVSGLVAQAAGTARTPHDVLDAIQEGLPLSTAVMDPFRRLEGTHTVRPGTRWRVFDGETLWTISVSTVRLRRHGLFWRRRRPSAVELFAVGRPDGRHLRYAVGQDDVRIDFGSSSIRCRLDRGDGGEARLKFTSARQIE